MEFNEINKDKDLMFKIDYFVLFDPSLNQLMLNSSTVSAGKSQNSTNELFLGFNCNICSCLNTTKIIDFLIFVFYFLV